MRFGFYAFLIFVSLGSLRAQSVELSGNLIEGLDTVHFGRVNFGLFRLVPYVAPSYSPEVSLMFSGGGLLSFKSQKDDRDLNFSTIPFSVGVSINGSFYFQANHYVYWPNDRIRTIGEFHLRQMPDNYFGIGYELGSTIPRSDSTTSYYKNYWSFNQKILYRIGHHLYTGVVVQLSNTKATGMNPLMQADPNIMATGSDVYNAGVGFSIEYDSRDFPQNAYRGGFASGSLVAFGRWLGSDVNYYLADIDLRRYFMVNRPGNTIAVQTKGVYVFGNDEIPWSALPVVGGNIGLRGYSLGRFRDKSLVQAIVEYRSMFKKRSVGHEGHNLSRWGYVLWVGAGSVAPSPLRFNHWLANAGLGLRFEVSRRMNLRFDYGFAKKEQNAYITFSESF